MKNIIKFSLVILLACSLAASCQKNFNEDVQTPASQPTVRTFTCTIATPDPDSKVAIDNLGKATWEVGDEILVHGEYVGTSGGKLYSTVITLTAGDISADGKTATISVPIDEEGVSGIVPYIHKSGDVQDYKSTLYACYPASAVKSGSYHTYYYNVFTSFDKPLMAAYDNDGAFVFYNMGSVITFSVPSSEDFDSYVFETNNEGITISYSQFSTRVGYHLTDGLKYNCPYVSSNATYGTLSPTNSVSGTLVCDDSIHYISIPGGANITGGFTMYFLKGGDIKKYATVTSDLDLRMSDKKGKVLHLGSISGTKLHTYTPPAHEPAAWTNGTGLDGVVDKSASPANSYILYAADANKAVKIKAVKGNSSEPVGTIASVVVLWETDNTSTAVTAKNIVADVDFSADYQYIFIKTPASFTAGNALIAAKNGAGDILWSWHIWMPSSTVNNVAATDFCGAANIQDRNLGALTTTALAGDADPLSIGLYYQWGRKDPFPGHHSFGTDAAAALTGTTITKHGSAATPEYSVLHPTEYIYVSSSEDDWTTSHPTDLWNGAENAKTIYDPCPAGYRVPLYDSEKPMWSGSNTSWDFTNDTKYVYNSAFAFPLSGYIDCYGGSYYKSKTRAFVWSATSFSDHRANCLLNYGKTVVNTDFNKAKAGSVRCVTE